MVEILRDLGADPREIEVVALRLYRRLLRAWNSKRFLRLCQEEREALVTTLAEAARTLGPRGAEARMRHALRLRSLAFRTGSVRVVLALAEAEHDRRPLATLRRPALLPVLVRAWVIRARRLRGGGRGSRGG
jgi:hypothetical protein